MPLPRFCSKDCLSYTVSPERHALIFNDIHYDPYHLTPDAAECSSNTSSVYGQYDCSASKLLLQSAFAASAVAVPDPIFIGVWDGDVGGNVFSPAP